MFYHFSVWCVLVPELVADLPVNPGSTSQTPARSGRTHNPQREPPANPTPTPSPSSPRRIVFSHLRIACCSVRRRLTGTVRLSLRHAGLPKTLVLPLHP
jgi:hypothetical protein